MKFVSSFLVAGGQSSGDGGIHKPSGQSTKVYVPRLSMLVPGGHEDEDEATDRSRRLRVPVLLMSHAWMRKRQGYLSLGENHHITSGAQKAITPDKPDSRTRWC